MKGIGCLLLASAFLAAGIPSAVSAQNEIGLESLGHVGIAVSDLQRALHFYVGQLGLKETFRLRGPGERPNLVYLQVGDSSSFVELFPGTKTASSLPLPKPYHFGFFVQNLENTLHRLQARGYPLPADAFRQAAKVEADGTLLYFIYDPDGNRIELSQATPRSYQAKAAPALLKASRAGSARRANRDHRPSRSAGKER